MKTLMKSGPYALCLMVFMIFACDKDEDAEPDDDQGNSQEKAEVKQAEDIPADPDGGHGQPVEYTFYSLAGGEIVADSNSADWDIALGGTTILINGGSSGPGATQAQIVDDIFSEVTEAPEEGYVYDEEEGAGLAIPTGSGNGWYNYSGPPAHKIEPIAGKVILLKNEEKGYYAKMEIISYYKGNPDLSQYTDEQPEEDSRYYTFRYAIQEDGSRQF